MFVCLCVCVCVYVCVFSAIVILDYHGNIIMQHVEVAAKLSFLDLLFWNCEPAGVFNTIFDFHKTFHWLYLNHASGSNGRHKEEGGPSLPKTNILINF